jgi:GTPase
MKKVGFVCIYGRANAGKSTLINRCLGFKLLPVSSKPQTTRDDVHAIFNDKESQIVFVDTPGIFKPHGRLGSILLRDAESAKEGVDIIVYVVDASAVPDFSLAEGLAKQKIPVILAFNKIDLVRVDVGEERLARYQAILPDAPVIRLSALKDYGIDDLMTQIKSMLPRGKMLYPQGQVSDRPAAYIVGEMIREKCMRLLEDEVPHSIAVDVRSFVDDGKTIDVVADIIVEKDSEKAIVIGKKGQMISQISRYSEEAIHTYFQNPVTLSLMVKTVPDWRNSDKYLKAYGYEE